MRIRDVVRETGVSRELIHHYLRNGLLPRPERRADYSRRHVLLLRLLKKLREDHHLPLDVIRSVFEIYEFDPAHLEPFTLSDSLNNRLTHLTDGTDVLAATVPAEQIVRQLGISTDRLRDYVQAKLVRPVPQAGRETYSLYDTNIIALCEHGVRLGIPLDSLRNISAYVRVAFELEHKFLFEAAGKLRGEEKKALGEIVVRQEIVTSLIKNLLQSLIRHRLTDLIERDAGGGGSLEEVLYRPSPMFCKRHGLDRSIEEAQETLCASPEDPARWAHTARLMVHAGRYRESTFFLEQALLQWPSEASLLSLHARALVLSGSQPRGMEQLCRRAFCEDPDPLDRAYLALCLVLRIEPSAAEEALAARRQELPGFLEQLLGSLEHAPWEVRTEARMIAGWVLHAGPPPQRRPEQGLRLLVETCRDLQDPARSSRIPGWRERSLANTAYLLYRCLGSNGDLRGTPQAAQRLPSRAELRTLVCSLDPAGTFAERMFLDESDPG